MSGDTLPAIFQRIAEESLESLSPAQAEGILQLRFAAADLARMSELGAKCNDGTLTPDERSEYEALVSSAEVLALWKAKARHVLKHQTSAA